MNRKERRAAGRRGNAGAIQQPADAGPLFAEATRLHQLGQTFDAEALCRAALSRDPAHPGVLHLLGAIAMQRGLAGEAAGYFRKATEIRPDIAGGFLNLGKALAVDRRPDAAAAAAERALSLQPDFAEAHNLLGLMRLAQGRRREASASFARALQLVPELGESFGDTLATLFEVNPALREGVARAASAWPRLLPIEDLLGTPGLDSVADDAMLVGVLKSTAVRDQQLEWFLTSIRAALLERAATAGGEVADTTLKFHCALAEQCFNNEYVFSETPDEVRRLEQQSRLLAAALAEGAAIAPLRVVAVAAYSPLSQLAGSHRLLDHVFPAAMSELLTQQIRNAEEEQRIRENIPRLTPIEGDVTAAVRRQYEENPYPRWIAAPSQPVPVTVDEFVQTSFPFSEFRPLGRDRIDFLIAGCGTGQHSIGMARRHKNTRMLAVDLSLSSLAYAERKTRELGLRNIEHGQADVMALGSIGRSFDVIDASGVLHHLADPAEGWRALLGLLRPDGLMRIGLYSERARADVMAARRFIAERGFEASADGIRRCRQELLASPLAGLTRFPDFFTASECRDLLFHVQEHRFDIPRIKEFLRGHNLRFLGFELGPDAVQAYRARRPEDRAMTDLDAWDALERDLPATFARMYQFWCQRV
jgi:SAM-dependent methyltransferase